MMNELLPKKLLDAVVKLLSNDEFHSKCRKNALEFASGLSWKKIYEDAFRKLEDY
ncbi:MAG: hypothetical protein ABIK53_08950 [bacterium]